MKNITPIDKYIHAFEKENFIRLLIHKNPHYSENDMQRVENRAQIKYLFNYLDEQKIKTIFVEELYNDRYYLDDFLHFYATCSISDYPKYCRRLHFFKNKIEISDLLKKEKIKSLKKNYFGFIVVKPINQAIIGRTILRTYENTNQKIAKGHIVEGSRNILTLKKYNAHFFGIEFSLSSLAFQEQDSIISACATTALWTVLEKIGDKFGYYSPSPYEIRKSATEQYGLHRNLPASGLNLLQIIKVIKDYGMEYELRDFKNENIKANRELFLNFCYSYLRGGFPIFLGVKIKDEYHAVSILGYHLNNLIPNRTKYNLNLIGTKIDKLYLHDDNIGPFAKALIEYSDDEEQINLICENRKMIPNSVIIPLYHKIRFPHSELQKIVNEINNLIFGTDIIGTGSEVIDWDCYITTNNQYKKDFSYNGSYNELLDEKRIMILNGYLPRFLWRCILRIDGMPLLDMIGDATEAKTKMPFFFLQCYSPGFKEQFSKILQDEDIKKKYFNINGLWNFLFDYLYEKN